MGTTGAFTLDLNNLRDITNNSIQVAERITLEISEQGGLIGLGIAISIALALIFGVVFLALNFIPQLIGKVKGIRKM